MKSKEKPLGTKAQIKASKERQRRIAKAIFLVFILLIVVFSSYFTYNYLNQSQNQTTNPTSSQLRAAIVDQLALTFPNQTFIETATNILKQAGYTADYYAGEEVTVEFYGNLSAHGYGLIILRVHSTATKLEGEAFVEAPVVFFTSESYSKTNHLYEQLTDQLLMVSYTASPSLYYFGIVPKFVTSSMKGTFQNTVIIMMGCEGLNNTKMAEAFIQKGAKAYIGWKGSVLASHTDSATIHLLQRFVIEKQTLKTAINKAMQEVGSDPTYNNALAYYPLEAGDQTIDNTP